MSSDNGLILEKVREDRYELRYVVADNVSLIGIYPNIYGAIERCVEEQKNGLEYGTRFLGF